MKKTAKKSQPTFAEMETRISLITAALVDGLGRNDIQNLEKVKGWKVTLRTIDNYISEARKSIITEAKKEREVIVDLAYRRLERIYQKALTTGNLKEANIAIMNQLKMLGIVSNTVNFQQNNFVNNQNEKIGNRISERPDLIELASKISFELAASSDESNFTDELS